jgi:hypothetical protein
MDPKLIPLHFVVALLASNSALAGQPLWRGNTAAPGAGFPSTKAAGATSSNGGSDTLYAGELPALRT